MSRLDLRRREASCWRDLPAPGRQPWRGRFDYVVPFAKPDAAERMDIMRICCQSVPVASDVDYEEFASLTEGLTGADIESLCKKATLLAIAEFQNRSRVAPFIVLRNDFLSVLETDRGGPKAFIGDKAGSGGHSRSEISLK